jgi:hypothetical protein
MNFNFIPFSSNSNVAADRTIRMGTLAPYRAQAPNISEMCVISAISIHCDIQYNTITVSNSGVMFGLCLKIFSEPSRYSADPIGRAVEGVGLRPLAF